MNTMVYVKNIDELTLIIPFW